MNEIVVALNRVADPGRVSMLMRFFKTGKGEYAEGDKFIGVYMPLQRKIAKEYQKTITMEEIHNLLKSPIHEHRTTALVLMTNKYKESKDQAEKSDIYTKYLEWKEFINNWDLVDLSAPNIVGEYLKDKPAERTILYDLAKSPRLWDRRISVVATFTFIRNKEFNDTLKLAEILLKDEHDLIHKAVGWMLREVGKRNQKVEEKFLQKHAPDMPKVMLRYAIEKFPAKKRGYFLNLKKD